MKSDQDDWRAAARENAKRLEHAIAGMRPGLASQHFPEFWRYVKEVSSLLELNRRPIVERLGQHRHVEEGAALVLTHVIVLKLERKTPSAMEVVKPICSMN